MSAMDTGRTVLILGVTGINGISLARELLTSPRQAGKSYAVYGVSRTKPQDASYLPANLRHIACDLENAEDCRQKLGSLRDEQNRPVRITHVFYAVWKNMNVEAENCAVNGAMLRNVFSALPRHQLQHFVLVTGVKHYKGPFESFSSTKSIGEVVVFKENLPRLDLPNFYYVQEDMLLEEAAAQGFKWHVARPATIVGFSLKGAMNLATTLAAYAAICKHRSKKLVFPGTEACYRRQQDFSDAGLIARHLLWEVETPGAANEAFNVVNGETVTWEGLWPKLGEYFGLEAVGPSIGERSTALLLEEEMKDVEGTWQEIGKKYGLKATNVEDLATWWFADAMLRRPVSFSADMSKSRQLGFAECQSNLQCYTNVFEELRSGKYIP